MKHTHVLSTCLTVATLSVGMGGAGIATASTAQAESLRVGVEPTEFLKYGAGPIIAIVSFLATAYYFRHNKRRKRVEIDTKVTALLTSDVHERDNLQVELDGRRVSDPYIVDLLIINTGHKDLASADFEGNPVLIPIGAEIVARLKSPTENPAEIFKIEPGSKELRIDPVKIAVGDNHKVRLLVDGKPVDRPNLAGHPLIDTDLTTVESWRVRVIGRVILIAIIGIIALLASFYLFAYKMGFDRSLQIDSSYTDYCNEWGFRNRRLDDKSSSISSVIHWLYALLPILAFSLIYVTVQIRRWIARSKRFPSNEWGDRPQTRPE
ncbi:hypothetical protein AWB85_24210 [Mycobacteroides immunogenum]|uniref:Uncharacterized protein n=1 Tax=Mycobacteroides immunogenum TaxID=83262 RepID=A0A179VAA2_9MYCO|nr:hypothetical protein [Mycobacteroides immunogenum]OAT68674.1 hypothetical protein AWB85_24210 [Mycobacteroides immunogenum]